MWSKNQINEKTHHKHGVSSRSWKRPPGLESSTEAVSLPHLHATILSAYFQLLPPRVNCVEEVQSSARQAGTPLGISGKGVSFGGVWKWNRFIKNKNVVKYSHTGKIAKENVVQRVWSPELGTLQPDHSRVSHPSTAFPCLFVCLFVWSIPD